ncbi:MAG TPA: hypothetical protein VLS89_19810 [Candidatus Nanopelagicales bacterium]|nr:hypothetical protein [Candidatus Nanopelagicales bacterium]
MKLSRVALGAGVGMMLAGGTVYVLTEPGPAPSSEAPVLADITALIAEVQVELVRVQILLDAGSSSADAGAEEKPNQEADADASVQVKPRLPASPASATGIAGSCAKPLPPEMFEFVLSRAPQYRQLPPDQFEALRRAFLQGSTRCTCAANSAGDATCVDWCRAKGLATGRCAEGFCICF